MRKKAYKILLGTVFLAVVLSVLVFVYVPGRQTVEYGVTFSQKFAEELGLDLPIASQSERAGWQKLYVDILDGLKARELRLIAYWDRVEPEEGQFDFGDLDWQVAEAGRRGAKITLVVGRKVPRWPECHVPSWAREITNHKPARPAGGSQITNKSQISNSETPNERWSNLSPQPPPPGGGGGGVGSLLRYIEEVIKHYRGNSAIVAWQIENEPLFPFGECEVVGMNVLNKEIDLVRSLDNRPIILTDSGELGFAWPYLAIKSDVFGTTLYRYVSNKALGDTKYWFIPPAYFRLKAAWAKLFGKEFLISELQAEPWSTESLSKTPLDRQYKTMNPEIFKEVIDYAERSGFPKAYLWGAEWWYWMKVKQGKPEMWEAAKKLF